MLRPQDAEAWTPLHPPEEHQLCLAHGLLMGSGPLGGGRRGAAAAP